MLALAISALITLVGLATGVTLVDCWISGKFVFEGLREERALLDAGFVPMQASGEHRARKPVGFQALATPARLPAQRMTQNRSRPQRSLPGAA